jgi:hydrogenase/urease accessory protein HupE
LLLANIASAHPEGFSGLRVGVAGDKAKAVLTLHTRDMTNWFPPPKFPDYVAQVCNELAKQPNDLLEIQLNGDVIPATNVRVFSPEVGMIEIDLDYASPHPIGSISVWSKHLGWFPSGHQQLLFIEDADGKSLHEDTLSTEQPSVSIDVPHSASTTSPTTSPSTKPATSHTPKRISFFLLGIEHIVTGYDHLLFLAALLLVCKTFKEAAGVITFFTIAHSITLSLAALDVVRLDSRIVEPAIAASIIYVGVENIFGRHAFVWRALITFAFGLVHGLGFASALREVGLGSTSVGVAMPLLKFSIGLETGQLTIAAVLLRVLLSLRKQPQYESRWVPICSILVALIGAYWLVTRVLAG